MKLLLKLCNPICGIVETVALRRPLSLGATRFMLQENISSLQLKKRRPPKKKLDEELIKRPGIYNVLAYSTADEYDLEALVEGLRTAGLYEPRSIDNNSDVVHAVAKIKVGVEPREAFFFREGSCVVWNMDDLEGCNLLGFLRKFERDPYPENIVNDEVEIMKYQHQEEGKQASLDPMGTIFISQSETSAMEKYTFSNAIALSVKLGVWEASLERFIDSIEHLTEDLKQGKKIRMTREEALRKHGELFALRHVINLGSDLLDVPDFYWDREQLETLYSAVCSYMSIAKRTRVMNEKINHCAELIELLSSHLNDKHHVRLEWMIIVLIMVEVGFEVIHYIDRYYA